MCISLEPAYQTFQHRFVKKVGTRAKKRDKGGLGKGRKGTPPRNLTVLKIRSPTNAASDWRVVVVLIEK